MIDKKFQSGFTLLELIVVITIFLVITGILIIDIPNFRRKSSSELITSEIATYIRGTQVYGTTQKANLSGSPAKYSIVFNKDSDSFNLYNDNEHPSHDVAEESYSIKGFKTVQLGNPNDTSAGDLSDLIISYQGTQANTSLGLNLHPEFSDSSNSINSSNLVQIKIVPADQDQNSVEARCIWVYKNGQIILAGCL